MPENPEQPDVPLLPLRTGRHGLRGERWEDVHEVALPDIVNEKPWHESSTGIEKKGAELGIKAEDFPTWQHFRTAVMRAAMKAA